MDSESYKILSCLRFPELQLIRLEDFEKGDDALLKAKQNRTQFEYYFTCTPSLPLFVLNRFSEIGLITYVDADIYFFSDLEPIFYEIGDSSIAIIEHRFPTHWERAAVYGIYNVGWLSFRRDYNGISCLNSWREKCIEWCYDRVGGAGFGDQKYLDDWPKRFHNVVVLKYKGANLAPWNLSNYKICSSRNDVWVDQQKLIFYHFDGLRQITKGLYDIELYSYKGKFDKEIRAYIYKHYLKMILEINKDLRVLFGSDYRLKSIRYEHNISYYRDIKLLLRIIFDRKNHLIVFNR